MKLVVVGPVHFERVTTVAGTIITLLFRLSRNGRQFTRRITTLSQEWELPQLCLELDGWSRRCED